MARRRDDFPPDRALQARMLFAVAVQAILVGAGVAFCVYLLVAVEAGWAFVFFIACLLVIGTLGAHQASIKRQAERVHGPAAERAEQATVRLAAVAGVRAPKVEVERRDAPLSWTTAVPFGPRRLHITTGMLDRLDDAALDAVLAHELAHVVNRDAAVMTVLAVPPIAILRGVWILLRDKDESLLERLSAASLAVPLLPFAALATVTSRVVSRHRELAADRAAAVLTGSPARVATALLAVSEGLGGTPRQDLRAVAPNDVLHVLPTREARGIRRLWATHPRLEDRVDQLERMEAALQGTTS